MNKRKPVLAFLLSIFPGLGQIYNGQPQKGLLFLAIDIVAPVLFGLMALLDNFTGFLALIVFYVLFILYRMSDGYIHAKQKKDYKLRWYNRWYVYVGFIISLIVVRTFLDAPTSTGIMTFSIPTPSMSPSLQHGDRVVANMNYYKKKEVQQGDIIVFNAPVGGVWVFRVVGMPKDTIEIIDGKVYLNNELNELTITDEYVLDDWEVIQYNEELNSKKSIQTIRFKNAPRMTSRSLSKTGIPQNEYFLMGDNRDNAHDSRFFGTIKRDDILGRVMFSYWGRNKERIGVDFRKE